MRSLHLTLMIFCQILLASFIFYSALTSASPLTNQPAPAAPAAAPVEQQAPVVAPVVEAPRGVQQAVKPVAADVISARADVADIKPFSAHKKEPVAPSCAKVGCAKLAVAPPQAAAAAAAPHAVPDVVGPSKLDARMAPVAVPVVAVPQSPVVVEEPSKVVSKPVQAAAAAAEAPHVPSSRLRLLPEPVEVKPAVEAQQQQQQQVVVPEQAKSSPVVVVDSIRDIVGRSSVVGDKAPEPVVAEVKKQEKEEVKEMPLVGKSSQPAVVAPAPAVVQQPMAAPAEPSVVAKSVEGVAEPVKRVEPVSASVLLVVQSPEPKITVVSHGGEYHHHQPAAELAAPQPPVRAQAPAVKVEPETPVVVVHQVPVQHAPAGVQPAIVAAPAPKAVSSPVVNGGLGPLHLLANTLCNYQPDKLVADETLNALYSQRASVRKSLFDFMSLKFTSLEKFSSRLFAGLEVVPRKTTGEPGGVVPSHGWPVVGKCTAHDLKLMAEAAWCEQVTAPAPAPPSTSGSEALDREEPKITSNHHRAQAARALDDQSAVISKILHVTDIKDAPIVESSIAQLNLTQQQLVDIQAQATSTRVCRRNALKLTKALFNHLAEEQRNVSDSWPQLYSQMANDDCARKRMIDIVNALAMFRTDSTSIRRDNVEFAFAMDDLRSKVLDSEVNVPLTFDKQFIEVEQFLQQSVKLMLSNIDPERAKLTQMRYRSLMPGPMSADDQCIELHQRLLAKNYPTDCNPTQFGQLPDVLRMAASSLELWSIENELSKRAAKFQAEYPTTASAGASTVIRQDVNECIANLVAS